MCPSEVLDYPLAVKLALGSIRVARNRSLSAMPSLRFIGDTESQTELAGPEAPTFREA